MILVVACGSDAVPATSVPATATAFVPPPTVTAIANVSPGAAELLELGPIREFPVELESGAPTLPREQAVEIAQLFVSNTRIAVNDDRIFDICSDGTGTNVLAPEWHMGETFTWAVVNNLAGRWNQPALLVTLDDPEKSRALGGQVTYQIKGPIEGKMPAWLSISQTDQTQVYDDPATCSQ